MKNVKSPALLAVLVLMAVPVMAQEDCEVAGPQECSAEKGAKADCTDCAPAVVNVPLRDLNTENVDAVTASLMKIGRPVYGCCPMCPDVAEAKPGDCKKCGMVLQLRETVPALCAAKPDLKSGSVTLVVSSGESLRLSQLTAALGGGKLMLDTNRLTFTGRVTLHMTGLTCGACVKAVGGSLTGMGITDNSVKLVKKGPSTVSVNLSEPVSYASLLTTFGDSKFKVADVSWATRTRCRDCSKEGAAKSKVLRKVPSKEGSASKGDACGSDCDKPGCDEAKKEACDKGDAPCCKQKEPI